MAAWLFQRKLLEILNPLSIVSYELSHKNLTYGKWLTLKSHGLETCCNKKDDLFVVSLFNHIWPHSFHKQDNEWIDYSVRLILTCDEKAKSQIPSQCDKSVFDDSKILWIERGALDPEPRYFCWPSAVLKQKKVLNQRTKKIQPGIFEDWM